jgi:hypothetical protein
MDSRRDACRQELAELKLQLVKASQILDEIEKRSTARGLKPNAYSNGTLELTSENAETRFAACVAFGMSKLRPEPLRVQTEARHPRAGKSHSPDLSGKRSHA